MDTLFIPAANYCKGYCGFHEQGATLINNAIHECPTHNEHIPCLNPNIHQ